MVSVIIPCYNIASYLPQTIESILKQSNSDWEIIAIDDGSTDLTPKVLCEYAQCDNRIKYFTKTNGGVSSARNYGLKKSSGEWVLFLDGDDLIDSSLIEMLNNISNDTDLVMYNFIVEENKKLKKKYSIKNKRTIFEDFLINKQTLHISSIAVRRNFILKNNIKFDENTYYGEDREFISKILSKRPRYECIHKAFFKYQIREGSAMSQKKYSFKRFSSVLASERTYNNLIGKREEIYAKIILGFTIARHIKMYIDYDCNDIVLKEKLNYYMIKYLKGFNFYGVSRIGLYTFVAGILAYNDKLFKFFLKLF